jgi:hypothetical protein
MTLPKTFIKKRRNTHLPYSNRFIQEIKRAAHSAFEPKIARPTCLAPRRMFFRFCARGGRDSYLQYTSLCISHHPHHEGIRQKLSRHVDV